MKKMIVFILLCVSISMSAQTYLKGNTITSLLLIPHFGVETSVGKKSSFQFDVMASLWKSVKGQPLQFFIFTPEYRYHFKERYNGFYVGAHVGSTIFKLQKWNYQNTDWYEEGFGFFAGVTIGYEKKISKRFMLDAFIGGGSHQASYKGYIGNTGIRYDGGIGYNKSGEVLPYRGGLMLSYLLN